MFPNKIEAMTQNHPQIASIYDGDAASQFQSLAYWKISEASVAVEKGRPQDAVARLTEALSLAKKWSKEQRRKP